MCILPTNSLTLKKRADAYVFVINTRFIWVCILRIVSSSTVFHIFCSFIVLSLSRSYSVGVWCVCLYWAKNSNQKGYFQQKHLLRQTHHHIVHANNTTKKCVWIFFRFPNVGLFWKENTHTQTIAAPMIGLEKVTSTS